MDLTQTIGSFAFIGVAIGFWGQIKAILTKIFSIFIVVAYFEDKTIDAITSYCWANKKKLSFGSRTYDETIEYVRPLRRNQYIAIESLDQRPVIFFHRCFPFYVGTAGKQQQKTIGQGTGESSAYKMPLIYFRWTLNIDKLVIDAMDAFNAKNFKPTKNRFGVERLSGRGRIVATMGSSEPQNATPNKSTGWIHQQIIVGNKRLLKWGVDEIGADMGCTKSAFEVLAFPHSIMEIIEEARRWKASEQWYCEKQIPWRRGWMMEGPPGTGKTSLAKAIAYDLDIPIFVFDIATMCNEELYTKWQHMQNNVPCIALLEDLDSVFHGRTNVIGDQGGGLSFDCLLNCISGVSGSDGVFLMVTTNNIDQVDKAIGIPTGPDNLSTRPGRVDRVLTLGTLDENCRRQIANRILDDCQEKILEIIAAGAGDTGAQFQERCTAVALKDFWSKSATVKSNESSRV